MVVMFNVTDPVEREHAMANRKATPARLESGADERRGWISGAAANRRSGGARGGDDRDASGREERADGEPAGASLGLLRSQAGNAGRGLGAAGAAGPGRSVLDRAVRALPALREGAGRGAGRDV